MDTPTKRKLLTFIIVISFLPILLPLKIPRFDFIPVWDAGTIQLVAQLYVSFFGSVLGLIGAVLLFWQYILGIRFIFGRWIEDHIWLNGLHQKLGKYGPILIFIHPIFVMLGYGYELGYWIAFRTETPFELGVTFGKIAISILAILWLTSAIFRNKLSFRLWKFLHFIAYLILPFVFLHAPRVGQIITSTPIVNHYFNFLLLTFALAIILRILNRFGLFKSSYLLLSKEQITHDVVRYNFKPLSRPIVPKVGQYAYMLLKPFIGEEHPFTISHFDEANNIISFSIKKSGIFSNRLPELAEGSRVFLEGPYGVFTRELFDENHAEKPKVLIAGGIGITPFLRVLEHKNEIKGDLKLFYGNKTVGDIAFKDFVEQKLRENVIHALSSEESVPAGMEKGFISKELLVKYLGEDITRYEYFICGPPAMMNIISKMLKDNGVDKKQIMMEKFSI